MENENETAGTNARVTVGLRQMVAFVDETRAPVMSGEPFMVGVFLSANVRLKNVRIVQLDTGESLGLNISRFVWFPPFVGFYWLDGNETVDRANWLPGRHREPYILHVRREPVQIGFYWAKLKVPYHPDASLSIEGKVPPEHPHDDGLLIQTGFKMEIRIFLPEKGNIEYNRLLIPRNEDEEQWALTPGVFGSWADAGRR